MDAQQHDPPPVLNYSHGSRPSHGIGLMALASVLLGVPAALLIVLTHHPHLERLFLPSWMITAVLGIILGAVAIRFASPGDERDQRRGRLAGILGCVSIMAATLTWLPTTGGAAKEVANRRQCISQLKQIGHALAAYTQRHNGRMPAGFDALLRDESISPATFVCPSGIDDPATGSTLEALLAAFAKPGRCSYLYFGAASHPLPPSAILACEPLSNHEGEGMHVLYANGSVRWLQRPQAQHVLAELQAGHNPPRPATWPSRE